MIEPRDIPATLRAIRQTLDLTQEELAERLDVSFASVNRWEGGKVRPQRASREAIATLAEEVGVGWVEAKSRNTPGASAEPDRPARRRTTKKGGRTTETSASSDTAAMERMLWSAACSIRGERDAAKFKDYLLPLLFLKRLSDVFDDEIARLEAEYGDAEVAREIAEEDHDLLRFYMPPEARWGVISGREPHEWPRDAQGRSAAPRDVGEHLTKAVRAVVRQNPSLAGVIDVVDFAGERNGERDVNPAKLAQVIETFSDPDYRLGLADVQPDFLGRAYEFLLRKFAEGSGKAGGEFFTPTEVAFLMAYIMRPKPGDKCHDYACGSAGLLLKLQLVARELDPTTRVPLKLAGQELQAESYATAKMNAIIHDMDVEVARGDTMINPKFKTASGQIDTHDIVVANPMWNQPFSPDTFVNDPFDRFLPAGGPTSGKGDWAWLQHTLACLNERGRAAVVLDTGAVTRGSGAKHEDKERKIRKWFVDNDLIEGVILLPDNLFYNTTAAGVIVVLSKDKPRARRGKIVLMDASGWARKGRAKNHLPDTTIPVMAAMFLEADTTNRQVAIVSTNEIATTDYSLMPSRWTTPAQAQATEAMQMEDLLSSMDRLSLKQIELKQAMLLMFASLSTGHVSLPSHWRHTAIRNVTIPTSTWNPRREPRASIKYVDVSGVSRDTLTITKEVEYQHHEAIPSRARKIVHAGDTIFATVRPALRRIAQIPDRLHGEIVSTAFCVLRADSGHVDPNYLFFAMQIDTVVNGISSLETGASYPAVRDTDVMAQRIPLPSLAEQRAIVAILSATRERSRLYRTQEDVAGQLHRALLHGIATGEIHVIAAQSRIQGRESDSVAVAESELGNVA